MTDPTPAQIAEILQEIRDTDGSGILDHAAVDTTILREGTLHIALATDATAANRLQRLLPQAEQVLRTLPGIVATSVILTAHRPASSAPTPSNGHRPLNLGRVGGKPEQRPLLPGVKTVIAVASGKGGVGKSTTAVNLAVGMGMEGLRVGLLDADVHGPSLPHMMGLHQSPQVHNGRMAPLEAWGVRAMSIGLLVDEKQAMVWRGPMVMGALSQLLGDVDWGTLDVLVVDMPPGTGDAQLTMTQKIVLTGAIIVSTPQDIALLDARRGVTMFEKMNVPILGVIENMSFFCCPNCGHRTDLFGHGGARTEAAAMGVPFLGEIPLLADIRTSADSGAPIVIAANNSPAGRAYRDLARTVAATVYRTGQ